MVLVLVLVARAMMGQEKIPEELKGKHVLGAFCVIYCLVYE